MACDVKQVISYTARDWEGLEKRIDDLAKEVKDWFK